MQRLISASSCLNNWKIIPLSSLQFFKVIFLSTLIIVLINFLKIYLKFNLILVCQVVCSNCSDNRAPLEYLRNKSVRVCEECFQKLQTGKIHEYLLNLSCDVGKREGWLVKLSIKDL